MSLALILTAARHSPGLDGRERDDNDNDLCVKGSPAADAVIWILDA
jgi:hypothetical protein